jgi:hypothetical protein
MDFTYFETAMAFLGLASIVIGSFADRLKEHVLRDDHDAAQGGKKQDFQRTRISSVTRGGGQ